MKEKATGKLQTINVTIHFDNNNGVIRVVAESVSVARKHIHKLITDGEIRVINTIVYKKKYDDDIIYFYPNKTALDFIKEEEKPVKLKSKFTDHLNEDHKVDGAGVLIYCSTTKRFLMQIRSENVPDPGKIGMWGGKMEPGETPIETALRELKEESGISVENDSVLLPLPVHEFTNTVFHSFLLIVDEEFEPEIRKEEQESLDGHIWLSYADFKKVDMYEEMFTLFQESNLLKELVKPTKRNKNIDFDKLVDEIIP